MTPERFNARVRRIELPNQISNVRRAIQFDRQPQLLAVEIYDEAFPYLVLSPEFETEESPAAQHTPYKRSASVGSRRISRERSVKRWTA